MPRTVIEPAEFLYEQLKGLPTQFVRESWEHYYNRWRNLEGRAYKSDMIQRFHDIAWEHLKAYTKILKERNEWDGLPDSTTNGEIYTP